LPRVVNPNAQRTNLKSCHASFDEGSVGTKAVEGNRGRRKGKLNHFLTEGRTLTFIVVQFGGKMRKGPLPPSGHEAED